MKGVADGTETRAEKGRPEVSECTPLGAVSSEVGSHTQDVVWAAKARNARRSATSPHICSLTCVCEKASSSILSAELLMQTEKGYETKRVAEPGPACRPCHLAACPGWC